MPWGGQQWLRATKEAVYGVFDAGAAAGDIWWIRLAGDDSFTMEPVPQRAAIRSADGGNRRVQNISSRSKVEGALKTPLYPTQAAFILAWASTLAANDLASYTLDFFDSVRTRRYLGGKVGQLDVECAAETTEGVLMATLALVAQAPDAANPTLAQPAFSVFPIENPYVLQESRTGFLLGTGTPTARSAYKSFKATLKNMLKPTFDESPYITNAPYCGRDVDFSTDIQYLAAADRALLEAQTALTGSIVFTKVSPAHTLTLNFHLNSFLAKLGRKLPLGDVGRQMIDAEAFVDSTGADFSFIET